MLKSVGRIAIVIIAVIKESRYTLTDYWKHVSRWAAPTCILSCGRPPVLRIHGHLRSLETKVLEPDDTVSLMKSITPEKNQQELQEVGGTDYGFAFGDAGRFRTAVFRQKGNISMVLRLIPSALLSFEQIGLPKIAAALCRRPRGLFLVTGPTGSGKTTTLASMINYINENMDHHIITVEEPIEYYHSHKKSIINQREVGMDVPTFSEALRRVFASGPGRDSRRRIAGPGNHGSGHHRR